MSKYVTVSTTNTWDIKYVTVSNTWAIKDTVTSYFTKYTLCSVNTPKIYLICIYIGLYCDFTQKITKNTKTKLLISQFSQFGFLAQNHAKEGHGIAICSIILKGYGIYWVVKCEKAHPGGAEYKWQRG